MKRILAAAAVTAGVIIVAACGGLTGEVVDKKYEPGYYYTAYRSVYHDQCGYEQVPVTTYSGTGTNRRSTTTYQSQYRCHSVYAGEQPYQAWKSACTRLYVRDEKGKVHDRCVGETKYYKVNIGDKVEDY